MGRTARKPQQIVEEAEKLFSRHGWQQVSVEEICRAAACSRVTFYKHFANKNALLMQVIETQRDAVRARLQALLDTQSSARDVMQTFLDIQAESLAGLYSAAMLADMEKTEDEELKAFFARLAGEKYAFMRGFFAALQTRGLLSPRLPAVMIEVFLVETDKLFAHPALLAHYGEGSPRLREDILRLLIYGLHGGSEGDG